MKIAQIAAEGRAIAGRMRAVQSSTIGARGVEILHERALEVDSLMNGLVASLDARQAEVRQDSARDDGAVGAARRIFRGGHVLSDGGAIITAENLFRR